MDPYTPKTGAIVSLSFGKFLRACILWQVVRFVVINLRMIVLILKSKH